VDPISTELYQVICYQAGLRMDDLLIMTVGNCLDFIQEFVEYNKPAKKKARKAKQSDFDNFAL
jgi:hypothetical protein